MTETEILDTFFEKNTFYLAKDDTALQLVAQRLRGETATFELRIGDQVIVEEGRRITARHVRQLEEAGVKRLRVPREYVYGKVLAHDVVNTETGEILAKANEVLTACLLYTSSVRFLGDDMVHAPRAWKTSPEFPGLAETLAAGAPMEHPLFPLLWGG